MPGRPGCWLPVCMKLTAGVWLMASVYIELMMHRSSTTAAVQGKSSLTQALARPYCRKSKAGCTRGKLLWSVTIPELRWVPRTLGGISLPCQRFSSGL